MECFSVFGVQNSEEEVSEFKTSFTANAEERRKALYITDL